MDFINFVFVIIFEIFIRSHFFIIMIFKKYILLRKDYLFIFIFGYTTYKSILIYNNHENFIDQKIQFFKSIKKNFSQRNNILLTKQKIDENEEGENFEENDRKTDEEINDDFNSEDSESSDDDSDDDGRGGILVPLFKFFRL